MPLISLISAYISNRKPAPLFLEQENPPLGPITKIWKRRGSQDPPPNTLLPTYVPWSVQIRDRRRIQPLIVITTSIMAVCDETTDFKILFSSETAEPFLENLNPIQVTLGTPTTLNRDLISQIPEDKLTQVRIRLPQEPDADFEFRLSRGTVLSEEKPFDRELAPFVCTAFQQTVPFRFERRDVLALVSARPTFGGVTPSPGRQIQINVTGPQGFDNVAFTTVDQVNLFYEIRPSTDQPRTSARPRRLKELDTTPPVRDCFDPLTDEPVDCETGEPFDRDPCTDTFIKIPDPNDIIHLTPRENLPWVEKADPKTGKIRWGFDQQLTPDQSLEFIRRREIRSTIERQTVPEFAQTIGEIMLAIDNIQDALLTVIVLARLGIKRLPKPFYNILVGTLGVADIMQLFATPTNLLPRIRSIKGRLMKETSALPFSKKWKSEAVERLARIVPTIGEVTQILQTTDWLFGVGLSLGAILGFVMGVLFGTELKSLDEIRAGMGDPLFTPLKLKDNVRIGFRDPCMDVVRAQALRQLAAMGQVPLGTTVRQLMEQAIFPGIQELLQEPITIPGRTTRSASPLVVSPNPEPAQPFTQGEYLRILVAYSTFLDMVEETAKNENMDTLLRRALDTTVTAQNQIGRTDSILQDLGALGDPGLGRLPFPGNPVSITTRELLPIMIPNARQALLNHINLDPTSVPAIYLGYVAEEIAIKALRIIDPQHREPTWSPRDEFRMLHAILDRGFLPPIGASSSNIQGALTQLQFATIDGTDEPPDFNTMARILDSFAWRVP